ncbi:MAG: hypothetical protein KF819_10145 [Labilithrix sp.]|nr:hypothetical protein [Labilithrix sp.]
MIVEIGLRVLDVLATGLFRAARGRLRVEKQTPRRPRPKLRVDPAALELRYREWAERVGLSPTSARARFEGRASGREIVFSTGLDGSAPRPPELVVRVTLGVQSAVLLTHPDDATQPVEHVLAEILERLLVVRSVGVTSELVRLTFEPGAAPDDFDAARDALEERLRVLAAPTNGQAPFR